MLHSVDIHYMSLTSKLPWMIYQLLLQVRWYLLYISISIRMEWHGGWWDFPWNHPAFLGIPHLWKQPFDLGLSTKISDTANSIGLMSWELRTSSPSKPPYPLLKTVEHHWSKDSGSVQDQHSSLFSWFRKESNCTYEYTINPIVSLLKLSAYS